MCGYLKRNSHRIALNNNLFQYQIDAMKLKLKEQPIEWLKFTAVIGTMAGMIWTLAWWKGMHGFEWWYGWVPGVLASVLCAVFPAWFRGFYRAGTTFFFYIGQIMGTILLTLFFVLIMFNTTLGVA